MTTRTKADPRTSILRIAEARRRINTDSAFAKECGMAISTMSKRMRFPGTATLDEVRAMCAGSITAEEALELIEGGKRK